MTTSSASDALKGVPMFAELRDGDVERIAPLLHRRRHRKNGLILLQGDKAAGLYVISAGRVKLVVTGEDGTDLVLSTRGAGDFFGELSLYQADMRISTAALLDVPQRVAHVLLELADEHDGVLIPQPVTHQFIAQLVGASRESVSRTMSQLTQDGLISTTRETATISERRQGEPEDPAPSTVEVTRKAIRIIDREGLDRAAGRIR